MYTCPVCGYNELPHPPENWMICPCCLTEFGYDDENWGIDALRQEWIQEGAEWRSDMISPPPVWSPVIQLLNIPYEVTNEDKIAIAHARALENILVAQVLLEINQTQTIVQRPINILSTGENIVIRFNNVREQRQSSDSQTTVWQPLPA